jgi:hypothetical protein
MPWSSTPAWARRADLTHDRGQGDGHRHRADRHGKEKRGDVEVHGKDRAEDTEQASTIVQSAAAPWIIDLRVPQT